LYNNALIQPALPTVLTKHSLNNICTISNSFKIEFY